LLGDVSCDKVLPLREFVGRGKEIAPRGCCVVYKEASVVGALLRDRLWVHSSHFIAPEYLKPQGPIEGFWGLKWFNAS